MLDCNYTNVLLEINNECNVKRYVHPILMPNRIHELIQQIKLITKNDRRLLVSTSYGRGTVAKENIVRHSALSSCTEMVLKPPSGSLQWCKRLDRCRGIVQ